MFRGRIGFIGHAPQDWMRPKVAAVIRVRVRRRVIRVQVHVAIVPIRTEANRAHNVGIDKVGGASRIPYIRHQSYKGVATPSALRAFTPYWAKQRSPPEFADAAEGA